MTDPRTAQGIGKMFPGTLGGNARPAQPVGPAPTPQPRRWVIPPAPPLFYDTAVPRDYVVPAGLSPPASMDDEIRYTNTAGGLPWEAPGISHDEPTVGPGGLYLYSGDAVHWFVPPVRDFTLEVNFWFIEATAADPTEAVTRGIRVRLNRDSDNVDLVDDYQTFTGLRGGPVYGQVIVGPMDILDAFTVYTYCNWGDSDPYPSACKNQLDSGIGDPPWPIIATGRLI